MGNLAADMVKNMRFGNTMCRESTKPCTDRAKIAEQVTIVGRQSTSYESELGRTVMRKERVGMLEESDQNEPVVYPQIGNEINSEHLSESTRVRPVRKPSYPKEEADIGNQNLEKLVGLE